MRLFLALYRNPWAILTFVFVILPSCLYVFLIHEPMQQVLQFRDAVEALGKGPALLEANIAPSTDGEQEELDRIKQDRLARIKHIGSRESLVLFNNLLADSLALQARRYGLQVVHVDLDNALITGSYVPKNDRAAETLDSMPGLQWNEIESPLSVPLLDLPFIELYMTVYGKYSQLFSFMEALPEFPVQVLISGIEMIDGIDGCFRISVRGFYYDGGRFEPIAQADARPGREESLFQ